MRSWSMKKRLPGPGPHRPDGGGRTHPSSYGCQARHVRMVRRALDEQSAVVTIDKAKDLLK